jgi:molybdate transport system permease protein
MMRGPAVLPVLAGLLALYLVAPFLAGLGQMHLADWAGADRAGLAAAAFVSLASATLATLLVAIGGIPLGYLLARHAGRGMALLGFVVQLPLALPPLASGVLLLFLLGYSGPFGALAGGLTDSFAGIVLAEAFVAAPFLVIAARAAFAGVDPVLEDVAATLGHRPAAVFRRVDLALAWRGILAGLLLTWLRAFGEFGATVMVAYHPYSLPVYTYVAFGSQGLPAMLPVLLPTLFVAVLVMAASQLAARDGRMRRWQEDAPAAPAPPAVRAAAAPGQAFSLAFRRAREGFTLDVTWTSSARRLCILGASGSGKSATLRLIAGLDQADTAAVCLAGTALTTLPAHARRIAYVPQNYGLLPNLDVHRQIRLAADADDAAARLWTARLGLGALERRRPAELSLGQQQRVALARALARPSRLILLDEPFSALDAPLRARLRQELLALQGEISATTILVTHDPAEALLLADEILLIDEGRVLQAGPATAVFSRPANELAARLLGADNIARGIAGAGGLIDLGGAVLQTEGPALPIGPVGWAIRPDAIRVDGRGDLPATLLDAGAESFGQRPALLRIGAQLIRGVLAPGQPPGPGPCRVSLDAAALQIFPATGAAQELATNPYSGVGTRASMPWKAAP